MSPRRRATAMLAAFAALATGAARTQEAAPEALARATDRLRRCLQTSAELPSAAFTVRWGPPERPAADETDSEETAGDGGAGRLRARIPAAVLGQLGLGNREPAKGTATGSWVGGALHLEIDDDELLFVGRQMVARDDTADWSYRNGRFADGNPIEFVPDPPQLLRALRQFDLPVAHTEVGTFDDRPAEVLSVHLDQAQVTQLAWQGLVTAEPDGRDELRRLLVARVGAARAAATGPEGSADLALTVDPATGLVQRLVLRLQTKVAGGPLGGAVGGQIVIAGGQVMAQGFGTGNAGDEDGDAGAAPSGPPNYRDGLPEPAPKGHRIVELRCDFRLHGAATLPELTGAAAELLRAGR